MSGIALEGLDILIFSGTNRNLFSVVLLSHMSMNSALPPVGLFIASVSQYFYENAVYLCQTFNTCQLLLFSLP